MADRRLIQLCDSVARSFVVDESFSETANEGVNVLFATGCFVLKLTKRWRRRCFLILSLSTVFLFIFFAGTALAENPGDKWVFGADSPVTSESHWQSSPAVSGDLAVWVDYRPAANGSTMGRIYYSHLDQDEPDGQPLTEVRGEVSQPDVSGNLVVWSEYVYPAGDQIFYMHIGDAAPTRLSPTQAGQGQPSIYGTKVVWTDYRSGQADIYVKDLATGIETPVCTDPDNQGSPTIYGDWVAWVDYGAPGFMHPTRNDIYARNMNAGGEIRVTWDGYSVMQDGPALGGDVNGAMTLAYYASNDSTGATNGIWVQNLDDLVNQRPPSRISSATAVAHLRLDNDKVVWGVWGGDPKQNVKLYDVSTGTTQQVSDGSSNATMPDISSGHIAWQDDRNGNSDIYQNKLGDTAQMLADRYRPELHFKHDINSSDRTDFEPRNIQLMLDVPGTKLVTDDGAHEIWHPTLQVLANNPNSSNYIDLPGSPIDASWVSYNKPYLDQLAQANYPITSYSRVIQKVEGTNQTVIQYWYCYYFNNWFNNHEGDWEMSEVVLDDSLSPAAITLSQHDAGFTKHWDEAGVQKNDTHPIVFVASGSHANYFTKGQITILDTQSPVGNNDWTGDASNALPQVDLASLAGSDGWVNYAGHWGQLKEHDFWLNVDNGPPGPAFQGDAWNQPLSWSNASSGDGYWSDKIKSGLGYVNDLIFSVFSPADINLYDAQGNHLVGKNADGTIDMPPGTEYFERSEDHSKNIVVHGKDICAGYVLKLTGTGDGTMDVKIQLPDFSGNLVDREQYLAVPVISSPNSSTEAEIQINSSKNFAMILDENGDGNNIQKLPDVSETINSDFTAPAQITDLSAVNINSDSVDFSWTATGDDGSNGSNGTASKYDLRYSSTPITEDSWQYSKPVGNLPVPQAASSTEITTVQNLTPGNTYYFGVKTIDKANLQSPLSNIASVTIPIASTTAGSATAAPASLTSMSVSAPYNADENANGAAYIQYKLSTDASWAEYGTVSHPETNATISGLTPGAAYEVYITYEDPDGVTGAATQLISGIQLSAAPSATNVLPTGTIFGGAATITADLSAGYGINPSSVSVTLDGNTLTGCQVNTSSLSCPVTGLSFGPHVIGGSITDSAGNTAVVEGSFEVGDNTAPVVSEVLPTATVYGTETVVGASFADPGISGGINSASTYVYLDGNLLDGCTVTDTNASCEVGSLSAGSHTLTGSVADNSGNATPFEGFFDSTEWQPSDVIYQSGLIPSQPSLFQLTDGRTLLVFTEQFTKALKYRVSTDGINWQIPAGSTGTIPYVAGVQPSVTQLPGGKIVVSYAVSVYNPFQGGYWYWNDRVVSSTDLISWSWPSAFVSNALTPTPTALDSTHVLVTYAKETGGFTRSLYAKKGTLTGSSWSWGAEQTVYEDTQYNSKPSVISLGGSELLCAFYKDTVYHENPAGFTARDIYAVRSLDGGLTWQNQSLIPLYTDAQTADFWPTLIKLNDGRIVCAFTTSSADPTKFDIKMVSSYDGGLSWGGEETISDQPYSETWPALAQMADGSLLAVWDSDAGQVSDVYYLYSSRLVGP